MKTIVSMSLSLVTLLIFSAPEARANSCPGWLHTDLKRAQKLTGATSQRYKISGYFAGSNRHIIGTARKKGPRCVVDILGHTLRLRKSGACVKFAFSVSGNDHTATWCKTRGVVISRGARQSATVKRLPVTRNIEPF